MRRRSIAGDREDQNQDDEQPDDDRDRTVPQRECEK
jgi:hypothetical protein